MVADKATFNALSGDPRRPDTVVAYQQPENAEDKVDPYSTIGMLLSGLGVFARGSYTSTPCCALHSLAPSLAKRWQISFIDSTEIWQWLTDGASYS